MECIDFLGYAFAALALVLLIVIPTAACATPAESNRGEKITKTDVKKTIEVLTRLEAVAWDRTTTAWLVAAAVHELSRFGLKYNAARARWCVGWFSAANVHGHA